MTNNLSHLNENGQPEMVDISSKESTSREAIASGKLNIPKMVMDSLREGNYTTKKGSIIQTAIIAGTMAVKNTFNTIPLCHQIPISSCKINIEPSQKGFSIKCRVKTKSQTGVEMEALHGVSTAALTLYDMCKAITHNMEISDIRLDKKTGGKSIYER